MFWILTGIWIICDWLLKQAMLEVLSTGKSIPVIQGVFHLTLVENTGVAFGFFPGNRFVHLIIPVVIIIVLLSGAKSLGWYHGVKKVFLSFIIAGAIGNLIDRIRYGAVIDYLDFRIWPVFNLADSLICIGFGALLICTLFCSKSDP